MNRRFLASTLRIAVLGGMCAFSAGPAFAGEGDVPTGIPHLDHVFVIMMENHAYEQIVGNSSSPFTNSYMKSVNAATNYFADRASQPDQLPRGRGRLELRRPERQQPRLAQWGLHAEHHLRNDVLSTSPPARNVCPIAGTGTDAATPVFDTTNEVAPPSITSVTEIDGVMSIPAASGIVGKTIADQLWEHGLTWKSYQESLPPDGADMVNNSDGFFSDVNPISASLPSETQTLINLYAVKHNPFVVLQERPGRRLERKRPLEHRGLPDSSIADLASGQVPSFSFIVPNQCNDQHGRGNAGPHCDFDITDNGTLVGLNPALIQLGDLTIQTIVEAIHASPAWGLGPQRHRASSGTRTTTAPRPTPTRCS